MTGTARILWIDDAIAKDGPTLQTLRLMQNIKGIHAVGCHPKEIDKFLDRHYDLFLVDYRLSKEPDANHIRYQGTGISIAGLIRDRFPDLPICLTSALLTIDDKPPTESEFFDKAIAHKTLSRRAGIDALISDALDYRRIRNVKKRISVASIHSLIGTPSSAHSEVERVLPEDLRRGLGLRLRHRPAGTPSNVTSGTIRFGRWAMHVFLRNPGVVYDDLYAATYLGVTQSYFSEKLKTKTDDCLYSGVFAKTQTPRWWKSALTDLVLSAPKTKALGALRLSELATTLFKVSKVNHSRCFVCKKPFPETVAYDRDDVTRRGPAHLSCSEPDPDRKPLLYFEPFRVFVE